MVEHVVRCLKEGMGVELLQRMGPTWAMGRLPGST